ncbi:hypothetical protein C5748_08480 [Phyllobacterium phragmitis]|uniref:DUF1344 domain-containing protein n=1 Tax=Phyllobacterium phragmitis TaxID=2670329 RepID=A0A2S9ITR5_9HYPH|nr:hypothetical protein [Phyllobacterium phragmitis]PRD43880.1 hypothetical protein C5748_08480 [Phyllobacterium phragmitis]
MRIHIFSAAAAILALSAYSAQAEDFAFGKVKMYDRNSQVVTLDSGSSFILNPSYHPDIRPGDAVVIAWQDNLNGNFYADYVGPATTMMQNMTSN